MKTFQNPVADFDTPDPFMTFDPVTGYPVMGIPVGENVDILPPSGEME